MVHVQRVKQTVDCHFCFERIVRVQSRALRQKYWGIPPTLGQLLFCAERTRTQNKIKKAQRDSNLGHNLMNNGRERLSRELAFSIRCFLKAGEQLV